jgi:hypothetical protein
MKTAVHFGFGLSAFGFFFLASGCSTRTIAITSEPPGAIVWLNDVEVGRTPLEADFQHYGDYDVRLRLEGYVPIATHRVAQTPVQEVPPLDLLLAWMPNKNVVRWDFVLDPLPEAADRPAAEKGVLDRAKAFRESMK